MKAFTSPPLARRLRGAPAVRAIAGAAVLLGAPVPALVPPASAGVRISEASFASGVVFPDEDVSGRGDGANDFVAGQVLRAAVPLGERWSFFGEASRAGIPSSQRFGDAEMLSLRGGFRRRFGGPGPTSFFVDGALGWMRLGLDRRALAVDRPVAAAGLGQIFPLGDRAAIHWEVRADATMEDRGDPVRGALGQPSVLLGLTLRFPEPRDTDRDGIRDARDACPGTPIGAMVDAAGCPLDEDYDGVPDGLDRCPGTPRGAPVDPSGCSIVSDSDGDGVPDGLDRCPGTPRRVLVDAEGCPRDARFEAAGPVVLEGVRFETGSARLSEEARAILDSVAESLRGRLDLRVVVGGHADGREENGGELARRRADAVQAYLIVKGVAPGILVTRSYGADAPIASDASAAGRAANRRVELKRSEDLE